MNLLDLVEGKDQLGDLGWKFYLLKTIFHHNLPSETITNSALIKSKSLNFELITPEKTNKVEQSQESAMQVLAIDEEAYEKKIISDELKKFHMKEKQSHLCVMTSRLPSENHKPDMEGTEDAELSKIHQKPRIKKHRPKVIIEGWLKKTPKPSAKEPTLFPENTSVKRKYDRIKRLKDLANTPLEGDLNEMDANKEFSGTKDTPTTKGKYVEKKGNQQT